MADLFQVVIVLLSVSLQAFGQQCKLTRRSEQGFVLVDHVFKSITANRLADCYIACNIEPLCQSLNYNLADKTCQFNNETQRSKPDKVKINHGFIYAENPDRGMYLIFIFVVVVGVLQFLRSTKRSFW